MTATNNNLTNKTIMIKTFAIASILAAGSAVVSGQGLLQNSNYSFDIGSDQPVYQMDTVTALTGGYVAQIYAGTEGNLAAASAVSPFWDIAGFEGTWDGGTETSAGFAVDGVAAGETAFVQVYAWDASYASLDEAIAAYESGVDNAYGFSDVFQVVAGTPADPNAMPPSVALPAKLVGFESFNLLPGVPEPTTIALGLMGLGLVALRARKK